MDVGSSDFFLWRLKSLIPAGWFARAAPIRDVILGGLADSLVVVYNLLMAVKNATRITTTTGWLLDLTAWDFFGPNFLRNQGESDDSWRARFVAEIFRERVTVKGIEEALENLTGQTPVVIQPWVVGGGYGVGALCYGGATVAPILSGYGDYLGGYGVPACFAYVSPGSNAGSSPGAGFYGSLSFPQTVFVTAYRGTVTGQGIPNINGYGGYGGGYGVGVISYATLAESPGQVSDDDIYAAVANTVAAGITAWVDIKN